MNAQPIARRIFGIPVYNVTMDGVLKIAEAAITRRRRHLLIGVVNAAKVVNMRRDQVLRQAVLHADVILADGMSVVWAARLLGQPLPERVTGIDLMIRLLERGNERAWRVFLLGATDEVLSIVAAQFAATYPDLKLVGLRNGYFGRHEEADVAREIADSRPDMLFVAMSSPKKEVFLGRWAQQMSVPVCHGVGGAFDVLAGKVKRAPRVWQSLGLEWLYRVMQEPGRLWKRYLMTNVVFCGLLLRELIWRQDSVDA
jgi:N-acetylglucosaminyldiphosphoundecaprenol N-acetyl-beta-D-mannosaminyltransferase